MSLIPPEPNPARNSPKVKVPSRTKGRKKKPDALKLHPLMLSLPRDVIEAMRVFDDSGKRSASIGARWVIYSFLANGPSLTQKLAWLGDLSDEEASKIMTLDARLGKEMGAYADEVRARKNQRDFWKRLSKEKRAEINRRMGRLKTTVRRDQEA